MYNARTSLTDAFSTTVLPTASGILPLFLTRYTDPYPSFLTFTRSSVQMAMFGSVVLTIMKESCNVGTSVSSTTIPSLRITMRSANLSRSEVSFVDMTTALSSSRLAFTASITILLERSSRPEVNSSNKSRSTLCDRFTATCSFIFEPLDSSSIRRPSSRPKREHRSEKHL